MYLIIKEISGETIKKQIPIKLYNDCKKAYKFIENYMSESYGEKWHAKLFTPSLITNKFICKQRWYRKFKKTTECLKIQYFKVN